MRGLYWFSLLLAAIGSINWGMVGLMDVDLVSSTFGEKTPITITLYSLVGFAGAYLLLHSVINSSKKAFH